MRRGSNLFLRVVVVLLGIGALAFLILEPRNEGRNVGATNFEIYFKDPFLAFAYVGSLPFFVGLYHAFKLLGFAGRTREFSPLAIRSLRIIRHCALAIIAFVVVGEILIVTGPSDDHTGGIAMGVFISFASVVAATSSAVLERTLQRAVDMKSEHDLTV